jgi:hypothetical protein
LIDLDGQLRLHDGFRRSVSLVGREQAPVLVVDNFLSRADLLVEYAATEVQFDGVSDTFYPGIRARLPAIYTFAVRAFLGELVGTTFDLAPAKVVGELGYFSVVTRPARDLGEAQRMPHADSTNPGQLAILHYLGEAAQGGTSFYRHRATGFESVDETRLPVYREALSADRRTLGPPESRYIQGDDARFERTQSCAAAFNRVLIYRSMLLHSADIAPTFAFDPSPRTGRLTANSFLIYR